MRLYTQLAGICRDHAVNEIRLGVHNRRGVNLKKKGKFAARS